MSICKRCGAEFSCAMVAGEGDGSPCWCIAMPPAVPVPGPATDLTCWCPACLKQHIAQRQDGNAQGGQGA